MRIPQAVDFTAGCTPVARLLCKRCGFEGPEYAFVRLGNKRMVCVRCGGSKEERKSSGRVQLTLSQRRKRGAA